MTEHTDIIQDIILEKIEKLVDEPGKDHQLMKWVKVLAWYTEKKMN